MNRTSQQNISGVPLSVGTNRLRQFVVLLTQQVLLVLVQPGHSLHQLPFLTAAFVVDEVPGQDFLQLPNAERLNIVHAVQV